jgi:hypothetical protein
LLSSVLRMPHLVSMSPFERVCVHSLLTQDLPSLQFEAAWVCLLSCLSHASHSSLLLADGLSDRMPKNGACDWHVTVNASPVLRVHPAVPDERRVGRQQPDCHSGGLGLCVCMYVCACVYVCVSACVSVLVCLCFSSISLFHSRCSLSFSSRAPCQSF